MQYLSHLTRGQDPFLIDTIVLLGSSSPERPKRSKVDVAELSIGNRNPIIRKTESDYPARQCWDE